MKNTSEDYVFIVSSLKGQLPSLPLVMDELMTIISDPNVALYAIKDIIKMDPSIYSQTLKVRESPELPALMMPCKDWDWRK